MDPFRSEEDAFKITMFIAVLALPVVLAAVIFDSGVALGVAAGLAFAGGLYWISKRLGAPAEQVELAAPIDDRSHRVLVIANETLSGAALREEIEYRARGLGAAETHVVCPALNSKVRHRTNEEDVARSEAQARLDAMLDSLQQAGVTADGEIGDDDPVQAIEDALRVFRADEVIISTHPPGKSNWLEADVVARARKRFPIPITHVIVDLDLDRDREFVAGS
jgi:GABA permease